MGKKRIQTTTSTEATRLAEDKDRGIEQGPGPEGNQFDIFMQDETDGVYAAEKISDILKKRGVCLCEANAPHDILSQAFEEAEVLWKELKAVLRQGSGS
ncbi:Xpc [Symbiodinium sp. KB8]|nr:Xpc [Symbiodinium sp. KB8]